MAQDTQYRSVPFLFKSHGLYARNLPDRPPGDDANWYINMDGCFEREESALSSRFGHTIINRSPAGSGTSNYPLPAEPVTLARLRYLGNNYRYAALADGSLYNRGPADTQGPFTQILPPASMSGDPMSVLINTTEGSAQPFAFFYDRQSPFKHNGTSPASNVGIFPPTVPVTSTIYAPGILLIDSFQSSAGYSPNNMSLVGLSTIASVNGVDGTSILSNNYFQYTDPTKSYIKVPDGMLALSAAEADGAIRVKFNTSPNPNLTQYDIVALNNAYSATDTFEFQAVTFTIASNSTGYIGKTTSFGLGNYQAEDFIVIALQVDGTAAIQEIRLEFDVNNSGYTSSYYYKSLIPVSYEGSIAVPQSNDPTAAVVNEVFARAIGITNLNQQGYPQILPVDDPNIGQVQPSQLSSGDGAWSVIYIPIGDFLPVGNAGESNAGWTNVTGWRVQVTTNNQGSATIAFNGLYVQGSPTANGVTTNAGANSYGGVGYDFRYTFFNINTFTESNPCLTADAWVQTAEGPRRLKDLIGDNFCVRVDGKNYQVADGGFFKTGHKRVYRLKTHEGFQLKATANHEFLKISRMSPKVRETEWVELQDLKSGDRICLHDHRQTPHWNGSGDADDGYLMGMFIGDGNFNRASDRALIRVFDKDVGSTTVKEHVSKIVLSRPHRKDFRGFFYLKGAEQSCLDCKLVRDLSYSYGMRPGHKVITDEIERASSDFYRGFLCGLFDADGSVKPTNNNGFEVSLSQSNLCTLEAVQRMLLRLGIVSTIYKTRPAGYATFPVKGGGRRECFCQDQFRLTVTTENMVLFHELIGFKNWRKQRRLEESLKGRKRKLNRERFVVRIASIEECGEEDVYDVRVPKIHAFDANGLYVHNCGQQYFSTAVWNPSGVSLLFPLRQAIDLALTSSPDAQVTHIRIYARGGSYGDNWRLADQIASAGGNPNTLHYKYIIPDQSLAQGQILNQANDVPVTSTLTKPIYVTLTVEVSPAPSGTNIPTLRTVNTGGFGTYTFVKNQVIVIGSPQNTEVVIAVSGTAGQFTAYIQLPHAFGEPVQAFSLPGVPCYLAASAYGQTWLAGDPNNPHYLYYTAPGFPENCPPQNYIPCGTAADPITAVINFKGTLFVRTFATWWQIFPGSPPYAQSTGSKHGSPANFDWCLTEREIIYQAWDGIRAFQGADAVYMSLIIEWLYRDNDLTPVELVNLNALGSVISAFKNNTATIVYTGQDGNPHRLRWSTSYKRWRNDDFPVSAILLEPDTNQLIMSVPYPGISAGNWAIVYEDITKDYDDGGWANGMLVETPIALDLQTPYLDLGTPNNQKQWNTLTLDINPNGQTITPTLLLDDGTASPPTATLSPATVTGAARQKFEFQINSALGVQAYRASLQIEADVTAAPIFYQADLFAAVLAEQRSSWDSYWIDFGTDESKLVKQAFFDYTSSDANPFTVSLYADGNVNPYYTFTLAANQSRYEVPTRVRFPAIKLRLFRMVIIGNSDDGGSTFQMWNPIQVDQKMLRINTGYKRSELVQGQG